MNDLFIFAAAAVIGLPVFVICAGLALLRKTRYFAIPPLLGLISGAIAFLTTKVNLTFALVTALGTVTMPLAAVCGLVALIGAADAQWPKNGVRNGLTAMFIIVAVLLVLGKLDRPGSEPIGQFVGTVRNSSSTMRPDGMVEEQLDIALDNGRRVSATAIHRPTVVPGPFPPVLHIPERYGPERVRVNEYQSVITGSSSYTVIRSNGRAAGPD